MAREVLVAAAGLNPQVITETLYYLTQVKRPSVRLSEIKVITTRDGEREVLSKLLHPTRGAYFAFCREYGIDPSSIAFDESSIIVLMDADGRALADIRRTRDNEAVAEQVVELIRRLTEDPDTVIHCSVAGGRKTLSVYMAFAMMLFGRERDTLSHVLVDEWAEADKNFFFPSRSTKRRVEVELAEIPYLRLRGKLEGLFGDKSIPFSLMVEMAQREIDRATTVSDLQVDLRNRALKIGDAEVKLPPKAIALYAFFAERRRKLPDERGFCPLKGVDSVFANVDEIKSYIDLMLPGTDLDRYRFRVENLLQDISKINKAIDGVINHPPTAFHYKILPRDSLRRYGDTRYGIHLDPSMIKPVTPG